MKPNNSPWLHQLVITRPIDTLQQDVATDIAIVGAGIAGVMTAYFVLKNSDKQVALIEGSRVAHGATGHNAGQIVFEFEREFSSLVEEYGLEISAAAERDVRGAWILLEELYQDAKLTTPMSSFMGYNGFTHIDRLLQEIKNNALRIEAGLQVFPIYVSETAKDLDKIPHEYKSLYNVVPHEDIISLLETKNKSYIAAISERKGCVNSAMLVEEIVGYLLSTYKGRFMLVEETHIQEIILEKDLALLKAKEYSVTADRVVLCTNGFRKFALTNNAGPDIDTQFHHMVRGNIGYMAGYLEELKHPPIALAYYDQKLEDVLGIEDPLVQDPYFYLTRRPFEHEKNEKHNLVCVGGPERQLDEASEYLSAEAYEDEVLEKIDDFLHKTYKHTPSEKIDFKFKWHGLMGYTPSGIRLVGEEPKNRVLLYNLGCNGVGILTSIYGGKRISDILSGTILPPSLFDPKGAYHGIKLRGLAHVSKHRAKKLGRIKEKDNA